MPNFEVLMPLLNVHFRSEVLQLSVAVNVILPPPPPGTRGFERKLPVLWLLHGLSDDHTAWLRRTSIERYVEGRELAVVMPAVDRSFYADMVRGNRYWTYISTELPILMRAWFPLSARREDNFAAGLSMGGYGAFKLALTHPSRFAAAASLSGALQRYSGNFPPGTPVEWQRELENMFGDLTQFAGSPNDIYHLAAKVARSSGPRPRLYAACGTEDFLYADNLRFKAHAAQIGLPLTYEEAPGEHEWGFWDRYIQRVLDWLPLQQDETLQPREV
jgi:S-formylglutathione hydrolase FrmB